MKLYSENNFYKLYQGNMLDMLDVIEKESIDSIVTDPPYGLTSITKRFGKEGSAPASTKNNDGSFARLSKGFMGKEWDGSGVEYNIETWQKCYEVLKPGGYLLAFGGSRTFHRIACAIEDAGFEIRDTIMWLYGSGFPKSLNIGLAIDKKNGVEIKSSYIPNDKNNVYGNNFGGGKTDNNLIAQNEWQGWGTCLKPSFEPIIVARKPFNGSLVDNVIKNRVGAINIDECRVGTEKVGGGTMPDLSYVGQEQKKLGNGHKMSFGQVSNAPRIECEEHEGRFPANTILTYDETDFDEVCGGFPNTKSTPRTPTKGGTGGIGQATNFQRGSETSNFNDSGSASRYFYCAKASKKDRDEGLDEFKEKTTMCDRNPELASANMPQNRSGNLRKNTHPTVKPTELMQYLVRLVSPEGAIILDPFNGSGSTGKAVMYENKEHNKNYKYIGIELTDEYLPLSKARIEYVCKDLDAVQTTLDLSDLD